MLARLVVLPEPVGPVTRSRPRGRTIKIDHGECWRREKFLVPFGEAIVPGCKWLHQYFAEREA